MHSRRPVSSLVQPAACAGWRWASGLLAGGALVLGAQAAALQDPVDLLQAPDSLGPAASSTLDRALSIDTSSGQRNLELLLEARGGMADVAAHGRAGDLAARRPVLPMALVPAAPAASGVALPPLPLGLQSNDAAIEAGRMLRREWLGTGPANLGQGGPPSAAYGMASANAEAGLGRPDRSDSADPGLRQLLMSDAAQFLRDNRFALLGGAAVLALLAVGLQAYARRS